MHTCASPPLQQLTTTRPCSYCGLWRTQQAKAAVLPPSTKRSRRGGRPKGPVSTKTKGRKAKGASGKKTTMGKKSNAHYQRTKAVAARSLQAQQEHAHAGGGGGGYSKGNGSRSDMQQQNDELMARVVSPGHLRYQDNV